MEIGKKAIKYFDIIINNTSTCTTYEGDFF
jgi:hypothetical protein